MTVQRFHSRPTEVEAIRWDGESNCRDVFAFMGFDHSGWDEDDDHDGVIHPPMCGDRAYIGDWIVKENGQFSVIADIAFTRQYEPVEAGES